MMSGNKTDEIRRWGVYLTKENTTSDIASGALGMHMRKCVIVECTKDEIENELAAKSEWKPPEWIIDEIHDHDVESYKQFLRTIKYILAY